MDQTIPITLTPDALKNAERLALDATNAGKPIRLYIDGKGCDGFYYGVAFDEQIEGDTVWTQGALRLVADKESLRYMSGSHVEWINDDRGTGFLVENPSQRKFRGKFYKRPSWLAALTENR